MADKLELTWHDKYKSDNIEPRILIENNKLSNIKNDVDTKNMLIHGDNLLALKALEEKYTGKIKCIYIDPPFNTGAAFEHYNDNLEHSIWLNLMYKRLLEFHTLLSEEGVILIEIDDNEMPYLRVILDEIFGRNKFVASISVKSNNISGNKTANKEKTILRNKDNIIVYKKGDNLSIVPQYIERNRWDTHYNSFIEFEGDKVKEIRRLKDVLIENKIINSKETIKEEIIEKKEFYDFILKYQNNICRLVNSISKAMKEESLKHPNEVIKFIDDNDVVRYALNGNRISFLTSAINNIDGNEKFSQLLGDLWTDIDFQNTQNEGGVSFPASKKPEYLIRRILNMFTKPGDIVLDSFLGSGTTCAVAHKMNRRWIGVEMGEHIYTHCIKRINNVIDGKDTSGISKYDDAKHIGGGYRFYELAPTLIKKDCFGEPVINKEYNAEMLAAAVALHEGFKYNPSNEKFWKQSVGNENSYLYVTTKFVTKNDINIIKEEMNDAEYLVIACTAYDKEIDGLYKNIKIKKIPEMLLSKCEFGKDNYNLNIINPPEYEEEYEEDE